MAKLRILSRNGDDEYAYDNPKAQQAAEEVFRQHAAQGYMAFATDAEGVSARIKEFDPKATEVIMFRQLVGG